MSQQVKFRPQSHKQTSVFKQINMVGGQKASQIIGGEQASFSNHTEGKSSSDINPKLFRGTNIQIVNEFEDSFNPAASSVGGHFQTQKKIENHDDPTLLGDDQKFFLTAAAVGGNSKTTKQDSSMPQ